MKFTKDRNAQKALTGSSGSSVEHEIKSMNNSLLRKGLPQGQPVYNVYFTNATVSGKEKNRKAILKDGDILVSRTEWKEVFSGIFVLLRDCL
jgi:hypothetical protein